MSSRLAYDPEGRLVAIETDGKIWLVVDMFEIFTPPGRAPTAREMAAARAPYNAPAPPVDRSTASDDDELDDAEAIAAAYREQRCEPLHLVSAA